jgi:hypothetical protein
VGMVDDVETLAARPDLSVEDGLDVELFKGNPLGCRRS